MLLTIRMIAHNNSFFEPFKKKNRIETWINVNVIEALYLMRFDNVRTTHLTQDSHNFFRQCDFFTDRPVFLEEQNVDIEIASFDTPDETSNYFVEIC